MMSFYNSQARVKRSFLYTAPLFLLLALFNLAAAQSVSKQPIGKPISSDLFGIFFEDISYAADGGLYAELVQNRSFEYSPADLDAWNKNRKDWNSLSAWDYSNPDYGYGSIDVQTSQPVHPNNPHYIVINVENAGTGGVGLVNHGFDGIAVKQGAQYRFSCFVKQLSDGSMPFSIKLLGSKGDTIAIANISTDAAEWKKYAVTLTASKTDDSCSLAVMATSNGHFAIDMVSLFPAATYKNRENGLRADLATTIADLKPKFMRFPGGCLVHGDGVGNIYRWKNTIGPPEQRIDDKNIWNYHQTGGLGYFEYFQFCEDIGAKPLPVLAAGVSCQNSGGSWRIGSTGQKAIPLSEMDAYIQDVFDLVEWATGPVSSTWGAKRAAAGHPEPFALQYLGIGNEDKMTPEFAERFTMIYKAVHAKYPSLVLVGTAGPFPSGEDYDLGWKLANQLRVPVIDEHYYESPDWFLQNGNRYDGFDRSKSKIYIGEYASRGNALYNAVAEAVYMTSLERNADLVQMASYAPLLANSRHTSWNPNLIYFNNASVTPTVNYYVQQLFSANQGDIYYSGVFAANTPDTALGMSCVKDSRSGDIILKIANAGSAAKIVNANLAGLGAFNVNAALMLLTGEPTAKRTIDKPHGVIPVGSSITVKKVFTYNAPAYSCSVIRIKTKK